MILFQDDWTRYPRSVIHYDTMNKSALVLASKLRHMGIENNAFFLALHNPDLIGIDPHSNTLTVEEMTAIGVEIKINPWYFFREVARVPSAAGARVPMVELNRSNVSLWWSFFNHIFYILTQPRQTGKSFSTDLLMTVLMGFVCSNTQMNLFTKDDTLRRKNVERLKDIYSELPPYLNLKKRDDSNNTEEITINALGNTYNTHVPNASPKNAYKVGRGLTTAILHCDELPFIVNAEISLGTALGAMGAAIQQAKDNDEPYGVVVTTTAGKKDDKDGKYAYKLVSESARWSERFYDAKNHKELEAMVRQNSRKGVFRIYGEFSHIQLGKDDRWLKDELERTNLSAEDADRDFFNRWTSGSQSSPLPAHVLEKLTANSIQQEHDSISSIGGYILRWYIPEDQIKTFMSTRSTVAGIDSSDASGGDDISLVLTDVETGKVVAVGDFNETNLITFSQWLVHLLEIYENMTMNIERRSTGTTILDYLLLFLPQRGMDPFKRLFNWVVQDPLEHQDLWDEVQRSMPRRSENIYVRAKKYFGFATSGAGQTARSQLYSTTLQNAAKRCADGVFDKRLTGQLTGLITKNGRVDHADGEHDDLVVGWLLCHWLLSMGKNLNHYGIDPRNILVQKTETKPLTEDEYYEEAIQAGVRLRIQDLFDLISQENDEFIIQRYEKELRVLDKKLILKDGESFSIDAFMNEVKEKKKYRPSTQNQYGNSYQERLGYNSDPRNYYGENTVVY